MRLSAGMRRFLLGWSVLALVLLYAPLALVVLNSFNVSKTFSFPPSGFTVRWWQDAWHNDEVWSALQSSVPMKAEDSTITSPVR